MEFGYFAIQTDPAERAIEFAVPDGDLQRSQSCDFGHPNLILFSGNDISPTAGVITNTIAGGNGRQIQFALRLEF